jgi:hypothetical protein
MIHTPIYRGRAQSDLDMAGFSILNAAGGGGGTPNFFNVKKPPYNATGDGATDDTAAIQAAINACATAGGGTVFFPIGVYLCNGAFDGTTNSVLKIPVIATWNGTPFVDYHDTTVELLGEIAPAVSPTRGSIIKCTKTGTGSHPAILSANPWTTDGLPAVTDFNYCHLQIRRLTFRTADNPSIYGLFLGTVTKATLEDVLVITATGGENRSNATEPTHGTAGIWMPQSNNFSLSNMNRVWAMGFDSNFILCEHVRAYDLVALNGHNGIRFGLGYHINLVNSIIIHCPTAFKFDDYCPVIINSDIEQDIAPDWQAHGNDVVDTANHATGEIHYTVERLFDPLESGPDVIVSGGAKLKLVNEWQPTSKNGWTAPTGTDLRTGYATSTATLTQVSQTLKSLIGDLKALGILKT